MTETTFDNQQRQRIRESLYAGFGEMLAAASATVLAWRARSRQRYDLSLLSARMLDDIGMTESERMHEVGKPFWRA